MYFNYMDLRVSITDDENELDRILEKTLECTNLDEYITSLSTYHWSIGHGDQSQEHIWVLESVLLWILEVLTLGQEPREESSTELRSGFDPC